MPNTSNIVVCRNRVEIEGINVGQFESLSLSSKRGAVGTTGVLTLPSYGLGITQAMQNGAVPQQSVASIGPAKRRVRSKLEYDKTIKIGAKIEVYCWYESPQYSEPLKVYDTIKVFSGFIEHIAEGFPTKLYLRDATFVLKFGKFSEAFTQNAPLSTILDTCISTAKQAFSKYRAEIGLSSDFVFTYDSTSKGLQLDDEGVAFNNFAAGRTPYQVIEYLAREMIMYAGCDTNNSFFFGYRGTKTFNSTEKLSTKLNIINRDIVAQDSKFVDYEVVVTTTDKEGKKITGKAGSAGGIQVRKYIKPTGNINATQFAENLLNSIEGTYNEGSITLLLYPKVDWLDVIDYEDTIFELTGQFFILEYSFTANSSGYYQHLKVTDKVFMI